MLDPALGERGVLVGDLTGIHALGIPPSAQRDDELGLGPVLAQAVDENPGLRRGEANGMEAVAVLDGALVGGVGVSADPDRDRMARLRQHAEIGELVVYR